MAATPGNPLPEKPSGDVSRVAGLVHKEAGVPAYRTGVVAVRPHCRPNDVRDDELRVAGRVGSRLRPHPPRGLAEGGFVDLRGNDRQLSRPNTNERCADRGNVAF